jgi:uncharacterized protein YdeI (YjbR/CyaY-like superfamily)
MTADYERIHPLSRAEWRRWLEANHASARGVWLVSYKARAGKPRLPYEDIVEEALCFGWIDSREKSLDADRLLLAMTPRKKGSAWARSNKERVERLIAQGRMTPAGMATIEAAKADGSWTALDAVEALEVPTDLAEALAASPVASANFDAFPASARRMILWWIVSAKRPETRARRIEDTVREAAQNRRANERA